MIRLPDDPRLDRIVERFRRRSGAQLIAKRRALRDILDALHRGRTVGVLLDQNSAPSEGVFARFFGKAVSTSKALPVVSLRTGAPVLPIFIRRVDGGRHRLEVECPVPLPLDGDVTVATFNRIIEAASRWTPEPWFWMHERKRTRPRPAAP